MDDDTYDSTSVCVCGRSKGWARVKIIANAHPHTDVSYFVLFILHSFYSQSRKKQTYTETRNQSKVLRCHSLCEAVRRRKPVNDVTAHQVQYQIGRGQRALRGWAYLRN